MTAYQNYETILYDDLKQLSHASLQAYGDQPLILQKRGRGDYETVSFRRFCADVDALGTALCTHGLAGGKILIIGENSYEWACAYMAVICGVGVAVPLDKNSSADTVKQIAEKTDAVAVIYAPTLSKTVKELDGAIRKISFDDLAELIALGKSNIRSGNRVYLDAEIDPNAVAAILFSSGTTEGAKAVMLSHRNFCFNLYEMCKMVSISDRDVFLSVLPMHHVYEFTCGFLCALYRGAAVAYTNGLHQLTQSIREVRPTVILAVPLFLETLYKNVWRNLEACGMAGKTRAAIKVTNAIPNEKLRSATKKKVFAPIHKSLGGRLRLLISGGTPIAPEILSGFRDLGFSALQGYGLTECAPVLAINRDTFYKDASVGMSTPNTLIDICDVQSDGIGEVRYKGDNVMIGYYQQPQETAQVLRDGWFYTGDMGYLDGDGFLYITGRKQNVIVSAAGKNIFPEELEAYLNRSPYIKECVVVGCFHPQKQKKEIVAIIYPDRAELEKALGKDLSDSRVDLEIKKAISGVNSLVSSYKRIETYLLRETEFPKNTSRKILRSGIAEQAEREYQKKILS